ncbi:hypothetical protein V2G26_020169 [Clonostachys chloroleuca]
MYLHVPEGCARSDRSKLFQRWVPIGRNSIAGACMCCRAGAKQLDKLVLSGEARAESTEWRPQWGPGWASPTSRAP